MAQLRIQTYMDKNKITPLFEELMNKLLHDQPDDPLVYLIRLLYRKAALPVPKDLKPGTLRRSSPERHGRRSPDKTTTQAWAVASGPDLVDRSYNKPWLTHSRKPRPKETDRLEGTSKAGRKQKQDWVSDTKVTTTTFDDLFEDDRRPEDTAARHHRKDEKVDIRKAWATNVGITDGEDVNYRSRGYTGPRSHRDTEDPLAGEIMLSDTVEKQESSVVESSSHNKGPKMEAMKHREELGKLLVDQDKSSMASGDSGVYESDQEEEDAIELLEDPDDLRREGVTNISKTGHKLSRILRQREEEQHNVKLNINLFTGSAPANNQLGNEYDYYDSDLDRPQTGMSFQQSDYSPGISDDEFESVSQVQGPRQPVWKMPDSEGDSLMPRHSRTLPEPSRQHRSNKFSSTTPVRFQDQQPYSMKSEESNIFLRGGKTWDPRMLASQDEPVVESRPPPVPTQARESVRSERSAQSPLGVEGGWHIPDDTEVSLATEWTEAQSSGRPTGGPPKAY